jgi:hypothetical protein
MVSDDQGQDPKSSSGRLWSPPELDEARPLQRLTARLPDQIKVGACTGRWRTRMPWGMSRDYARAPRTMRGGSVLAPEEAHSQYRRRAGTDGGPPCGAMTWRNPVTHAVRPQGGVCSCGPVSRGLARFGRGAPDSAGELGAGAGGPGFAAVQLAFPDRCLRMYRAISAMTAPDSFRHAGV